MKSEVLLAREGDIILLFYFRPIVLQRLLCLLRNDDDDSNACNLLPPLFSLELRF